MLSIGHTVSALLPGASFSIDDIPDLTDREVGAGPAGEAQGELLVVVAGELCADPAVAFLYEQIVEVGDGDAKASGGKEKIKEGR